MPPHTTQYYGGKEKGDCGNGVFCAGMTFSLDGYWYSVTNAYSHLAGATPTDEGTCRSFNGIINDNNGRRRHARRLTAEVEAAAVAEASTAAAAATSATGASTQSFGLRGVIEASEPATADPQSYGYFSEDSGYGSEGSGYGSEGGYQGGYDGSYAQETVYQGRATMVSGVVSALAGPRKEKWEGGVFEWVVDFAGTPNTGRTNPSVPWVQDKQFKMTFYGSKGYEAAAD